MTEEERAELYLDLLFSPHVERNAKDDLRYLSEYFESLADRIDPRHR